MRITPWLHNCLMLSSANATIINVPADLTTIQGGIDGAMPAPAVLVTQTHLTKYKATPILGAGTAGHSQSLLQTKG